MSCAFAYRSVTASTEITATSQLRAMANEAGLVVDPDDTIVEIVATKSPVSARLSWQKLLDRLYTGDVLFVPDLFSLGRDAQEVHATVKLLTSMGVRVRCLVLGRIDLANVEGKGAMDVLAAVAALGQCMQIEHLRNDGPIIQAKHTVARRGRPLSLRPPQVIEGQKLLNAGVSVIEIARRLKTSRQTIMRLRARSM